MSRPVRLLDLAYGHCRWPVGDVRGPGTLFCGAPKDGEHAYCRQHRAIAYGRGTPSERAAVRDAARAGA